MNIFIRNNVDYTPIFWLWVAICLIVLTMIYVEAMCSIRRQALKRVRPMIEEFLIQEATTLTVNDYIKAIEDRFGRRVWMEIHTMKQLAPLHMVLHKDVELVS